MITVEELKQCKKATEKLTEAIKNRVEEVYDKDKDYLEDGFGFEHEGVFYDVIAEEESSWDDQGKYQYQDITYQLVSYDRNIKKWACKESMIDEFDLFLFLTVQRSGSYFSDYDYSYDKPILQIATIETVPEQIIPEHEEVKIKHQG